MAYELRRNLPDELARAAVEIATTEAALDELQTEADAAGVAVQSPPDRTIRFSA